MPERIIGAVFDFDGTVTFPHPNCWELCDRRLDKRRRAQRKAARKKYLPLYEKGQLTPELSMQWLIEGLNSYVGIISKEILDDCAYEAFSCHLQPGFIDFVYWLKEQSGYQVRIAIISYGIADLIESILRQMDEVALLIDDVYATRLAFKDGIMIGYEPDTLVTGANKFDFTECFMRKHGISSENVFCVGDTAPDHAMAPEQGFRVLIGSQKNNESIGRFFHSHATDWNQVHEHVFHKFIIR